MPTCKVTFNPLLPIHLFYWGPTAVTCSATLDGAQWDEPKVFAALQAHQSKLPYLPDLLVAFCQGALETWIRFTDEFAPGGTLASLTPEQRSKAFMPPTNDANEGALGTWRVWTRRFPSLTLHRFNAITMNRVNNTGECMNENFTPEQYAWTRSEAWHIDSSKQEETRKAQLVSAAIKEAESNEAARLRRADRGRQREQHIAGIQLVLNQEEIQKMKGVELDNQLKLYKQVVVLANQQTFPAVSKLKVANKRRLVAGLALKYVQGQLAQETSSPNATT